MLVLPALHTYLIQLLSPPSIHTALLLTPEGALVSYATQMTAEGSSAHTPSHKSQPSSSSNASGTSGTPSTPSTPRSKRSLESSMLSHSRPSSESVSDSGASTRATTGGGDVPRQRGKDEIRIVAGLSAEVWAETRGDVEGMVESELGRIVVVPVEEEREGQREGPAPEPLLLLAVNGSVDADWDAMSIKAHKLAAFLAPSVNKHRGSMGTPSSPANGAVKSRTRSTATSPGRGVNRGMS